MLEEDIEEIIAPWEDESHGYPVPSRSELGKLRRAHVFGKPALKPARIGDFRGSPAIKRELVRLIHFFRNYRKYAERNARIQPGILLEGPPGTGKTLTARIIATESGCHLVDASSFPRPRPVWSGDDIRALFSLARKYHQRKRQVVIVYFDRLEDVCLRIGMRQSTSAILSELDGLAGKPRGVFVLAATTSSDRINPEVLRSGRIGYRLYYSHPDAAGRFDILQYYVKQKPHEPMDLETFARIIPGRTTPAEIEEMVERAYIHACTGADPGVTPKLTRADLVQALLELVLGPPVSSWSSEQDRYLACVHEAGHTIVATLLGMEPKLVVVPKHFYTRGCTLYDSERDLNRELAEKEIASALAGSVAEELVFGSQHLGCAKDCEKATELSLRFVAEWGDHTNYCDTGGYLPEWLLVKGTREHSRVYDQARELRQRCRERARAVLEGFGKQGIERVARVIFEREFLLGDEIKQVVGAAQAGVGLELPAMVSPASHKS